MPKIAATGPEREKHHCGKLVVKARSAITGHVIFLDHTREVGGRIALQLDLAGGLPVASKSERHTHYRHHKCPAVGL